MFTGFVIFLPLLVTMVLAMLLGLDLLDEPDNYVARTKTWLLVFVLTCVFLYAGHAAYFTYSYELIPVSDTLYNYCSPAVYPAYYIYVCELSHSRRHWYSGFGWLIAPLLCCLGVGVCYVLMDEQAKRVFYDNYLYANDLSELSGMALMQAYAHEVEKWVFCLEIVPLAVLALRRIRHYNDLVQSNYADASQHSLVMVRLMFVLFLVTSVLSAFSNMLGRYRFLDDTSLLAFPSVVFSLLIFMQVYIGMRYNYPAIADDGADTGPQEGMLEKTAAAAPQVSDRNEKARQEAAERMRELRRRIEKLMDEEKIFLQNGLKISDLAEQLCCNRNYIYRAINVEMGISFAEYVNKKRVDYAKQMIEQKPDLQMNELYMRVGFSSSSSFYRCFRQFEGCTPKELQERLRKDKQQASLAATP